MNRIKAFWNVMLKHPIILCIVVSPFVNLFVESLGRRSVFAGISHMIFNPLVFAYNSLIIFATLSVAQIFKRKIFFIGMFIILWAALGITNGILRSFRTTPLSAVDFFVVKAEGAFFASYFSWWQIALILLLISALIALAVFLWKVPPRQNAKRISAFLLVIASFATLGTATVVGMETEVISNDFVDLTEAYENYGFVFCFSCSLLDTGIEKPEDYSCESVEALIEKLGEDKGAPSTTPDIIAVQLESFFDPGYITDLEVSEDVIPNFRALANKYPSGRLFVQSIGGGTANTEFEVLTGMNLDHFGPGEYPYMTVLSDGTCESLPYNLAALGYRSHALHNYTGVFYDRHKVYANLGFNTFTPVEYMTDLYYNTRGWVKDMRLVDEITAALDAEEGPGFVWAVSVQPHGAYPDEKTECDYDIKAAGIPEEEINATEYYLNQIKEVDDFIGALVKVLEKRETPTVLLLYGDHLPPLDIEECDLDGIDAYTTEYVIWSNFDIDAGDRDLEAYELPSHMLSLIGYDTGLITKINQSDMSDQERQRALSLIEYDMLYGENYAGVSYAPTEMKLGRVDIKVTGYEADGEDLLICGENFTEWSRVKLGLWEKETEYVSSTMLRVKNTKITDGDEISVSQVSASGVTLGESNVIVVK